MIERLRLRHWRAFDSIDLSFDGGTTFVVATNGVGKTSLLLGVAWAIFGDHAPVKARDCIRAGATNAEAEVSLLLDNDRRLVVRRTLTEKGKTTADHELNGTKITDSALEEVLNDSFGAQPSVAAQLAMMIGGGHVASELALNLEEHLYHVFGVTSLRNAAERAAALAKAAVKERENTRSVAKQQLADRHTQETELTRLDRTLDELRRTRATLVTALNTANSALDLSEAWTRYEAESSRRRMALVDVVAAARDLGLPDDPHRLPMALEAAITRAREDLQAVTEDVTQARARAHAAENALTLLQSDDPSCPTCLRPFHSGELDHAVHEHRAALVRATVDESRSRDASSRQEQHLAQLKELNLALQQLPPEPIQPASPPTGEDPKVMINDAMAALQEHDMQVGHLKSERDAVAAALSADEDLQRAAQAERNAYRHEAVTRAAATALADAAEQLTRSYIEPLSQQIRWRWKALFGEEGLQLNPDGTIIRRVGDRELPWETLSGGERIWARLVTHILVLATSTRLPFAWFDEPLEHLDPRARRAVAAALATATRAGGPDQLIVTTYEHAIARQLAADVPEARIRYIRRSVR